MKIKKIALFIAMPFLVLCLTACNTIQGAGKDIQQGGKAIQRASQS